MIHLIIRLILLAIRLASILLVIYCVMSFLAPQSELYTKLERYVEPMLRPVRERLWRWFPKLRTLPVDISPLALWLLLDVLTSVVRFLW